MFEWHPEGLKWVSSGLDNAGKTTVVKHINGEDFRKVGPTLGFAITTLLFQGYV